MSITRLAKLANRGDTIVEVMMVLAILGSAIGISYATASRSLKITQQAQASSQASRLVQTQIEQLRILAKNDPASIYVPNLNLCIYDSDPDVDTYTPAVKTFTLVDLNVASNYPAECRQPINGDPTDTFNISIRWQEGGDTYDKFTIRVKFDDLLGEGIDTSTVTYRLHKDS